MGWPGLGLVLVTILTLVLYGRELLLWRKGMLRAFRSSDKRKEEGISSEGISIVIPVRNESGRWERLFDDLQNQSPISGNWEVLFVDDHSDDGSNEALKKACTGSSLFQVLELPNGREGKKRALEKGIKAASYEWVLTLDADCRVRKDLLQGLFEKRAGRMADLYLLPVLPQAPSNFREHLYFYEALALLGVLIGSAGVGAPRLANGAGMFFDRSVFFEEGGYDGHLHIDSGDDLFLLQQWLRNGRKIAVLPKPRFLVRTRYPRGMNEWVDQRLRWATKAKVFQDRRTLYALGLVGAMDMLLILNGLLTVVLPSHFPLLLFSWGVKGGLDRIFLISSLQRLGKSFSWKHFPFALLLHPFQVVVIPLIALFRTPVWKGRRIADH